MALLLMALSACSGGGTGDEGALAAPTVSLAYGLKTLQFSWPAVAGAAYYQLFENPDGISGFRQVGSNITTTSVDHVIALHKRLDARYLVAACNSTGCAHSAAVFPTNHLADAIGYFKASNTAAEDAFGFSLALSADGNTMAVGAYLEDSGATGVNGDQADNSASAAGAVYIFTRDNHAWSQQAYVKASNSEAGDQFGIALALSGDSDTLVVGAPFEDSGVNSDQADNSASDAGAAYVFLRNNDVWSQQAYVKASNSGAGDLFGISLALSGDGNTLVVGAPFEDSGVNSDQADNSASDAGAAYVFLRNNDVWSQQAYVKASNSGAGDQFGHALGLTVDGNGLAVSAPFEDSPASGIDGTQGNDATTQNAGAAYVFLRNNNVWSQQAYVKASNTGADDQFGRSLALAGDGATLAVGAWGEDSSAIGVGGQQADNSATAAGAAYVFTLNGGTWFQQAYVKASNTEAGDRFGRVLALSGDGDTLAVSADLEDSNATGVGGNQQDNSASAAGAVYLY